METLEVLVSTYRDLASAHSAATQRGDHKAANKSHDQLLALVPKIKAHGVAGERALMRRIEDRMMQWHVGRQLTICDLPRSLLLTLFIGYQRGMAR
jgi:hypothetical protein